jgi:SAM-dependent methyltransferase
MTSILADFAKLEPYLDGNAFSSDLVTRYARSGPIRYRNDILVEACTGKNVLHIGCCDHVPLIARKWQQREWLHGQLTTIAGSVLGVDIDADAVSQTRRITGHDNIVAGDITSDHVIDAIAERYFDIVLFGEVVEHIGDPVRFLKTFLRTYERNVRDVIITVPNAFRAGNVKSIFANREVINSDHRLFFTPYTICKVACDAGVAPSCIQMASFSRQGPVKKLITSRWPLLAENIVFMGRPAHRSNLTRDSSG